MQTNNFDISDSGRIIIEDRIFYSTNTDVSGLIENANTKEKGIVLKRNYYGITARK